MRKLLLFSLLAAMLAVTAAAQESPIDKGSMVIGGSAYFQSLGGDAYKWGDDSYTAISITPGFGYFMSPGFLIGGELLYASEKQGDDTDVSKFGIGPMVGYYFNMNKERTEIKGTIYPYVKGFFSFQSWNDHDNKTTWMSFGGGAGIDYMLSNAVAVDFGLRVSMDSKKPEGADESVSGTNMVIGAGIAAFLF